MSATLNPPPVDPRNAAAILAELEKSGVATDGLGGGLAALFAGYCELIIDRLNRAPDKNFLAYLDLLGNTLLPPSPARVPLTFSLASGASRDALVPAGTQVATQLLPGELKPITFETERELVVVPILLTKAIARDSRTDLHRDVTALADPHAVSTLPAFKGEKVIVHDLYIALDDDLFLPPLPSTIKLTFKITQPPSVVTRDIVWQSWDGARWLDAKVSYDQTNHLSVDGQINLENVLPGPRLSVNGIMARWVRCHWKTPISTGSPKPGMIPEVELPLLQDIQSGSTVQFDRFSIQAAFFNDKPIDLTKDFLPLGASPRVGDTFYLMSPSFGHSQSYPVFNFVLSDAYKIFDTGGAQVNWEFWNGISWVAISGGDVTSSFTYSGGGGVNVGIVGNPQPRQLNGLTGFWVRARLSAGNYGQDVHVDATKSVVASTLNPPSYKSMEVVGAMNAPNRVATTSVTCNDWIFESRSVPFVPFRSTRETSLGLGFSLPPDQPFLNRTVSLYVSAAPIAYGSRAPDNPSPQSPPHITWQYWNGAWTSLTVNDETRALTRSGALQFLAPTDFSLHSDAGANLYWIRGLWDAGDYELEPLLCNILTNTVTAIQASTLRSEILGSSTREMNQTFSSTRSPILGGQQLQVREPAVPSAEEQVAILAKEGNDAITIDSTGVWVRWHAVPDFYGSGPGDRDYLIDPLTGGFTFGDGQNGLIPFAGSNNIRLAIYRSGGGIAGNRPLGNITQLKTTLPYVDRVINYAAAQGGAESEELTSLRARGPRTVRHGGRAVTSEDYEDLAKLSSPGVARAKCAPTRDLAAAGSTIVPGHVSLIVVAATTEKRPAPTMTLLADVQDYVDQRRIPTADLTVVGPPFVKVSVSTTVALISLDVSEDVQAALQVALTNYLHPLTGGHDSNGWDFGRQPHRAELFALVASVPGVLYVKSLSTTLTGEPANALNSGYFLVYSGSHTISMVFEG